MIKIVNYSPDLKREWNDFVTHSVNGLFLFHRDYMEYHSDRFTDFSLMFYKEGQLVSLLPANIEKNVLISHGGLTFGGFIINEKMTTSLLLKIFDIFKDYLKSIGIVKVIYKCIPYIYHKIPSEQDRYVLFRNNAQLIRRDVTSTIDLQSGIKYLESRYRMIKKARQNQINIIQTNDSDDYANFWDILTTNLMSKYGKRPVHTLNEILYLRDKFPNNIKLFVALKDDTMLGGVVIYESENVAHAQYIASSPLGKKLHALDLLFDYLINYYRGNKRYFDFGISTENEGRYLNENLIFYKESFMARAVVHDFYEVLVI